MKINRIAVKLRSLKTAKDDYDLDKVWFETDLLSPNSVFRTLVVFRNEFITGTEEFLNKNFEKVPIEYFNRDKSPNPVAKCSICGATNVRIYRYSNSSHTEAKCNNCLDEKDYLYYMPFIYDKDSSIWGYTSVPEIDCARFYALPEANLNKKYWKINDGFSMTGE